MVDALEVAVVDIGNYFDLRLPGPVIQLAVGIQNGPRIEKSQIYPSSNLTSRGNARG